jgi:pimeloyl-ACP methyl ester carboxylesterase
MMVRITSRTRPEGYVMSLNGDDLVDLLFNMLYDTDTIPLIPRLISQMAEGDYSDPTLQAWLRWLIISSEYRSLGLWYSVMCAEEANFSSEELVRQAGAELQPNIKAYFIDVTVMSDLGTCARWGAKKAPRLENEPVFSQTPTLVLAGDYDPITPPAWSQLAAETLSPAYYVEFPGVGHGVLHTRPCAREIAIAFLDAPMVEPDIACLAELPPFEFIIDP